MSISICSFHAEKKQKIDHGSEGSCSSAAKDMDLGEEAKNVPDIQEKACNSCGKIGDHLTEDCTRGIYGRMQKYDQNTILITNLPEDVNRDILEGLCRSYGPVPRSYGPGFKGSMRDEGMAAFENREDAQMAIEKLNGSTFRGRVLTVDWALERNVPVPENKCKRCGKIDGDHLEKGCPLVVFAPMRKHIHNAIVVRNFAGNTNTSDITSLCSTFGPVACVFEPGLHYKGKSHLGLMVAFEKKVDAENAYEKLNGHLFNGCVLTVEWAVKNS